MTVSSKNPTRTGRTWRWGAVTGFPAGSPDPRRALEVVRRVDAAGADLVLLEAGPDGVDSHDTASLAGFASSLRTTAAGVVPGGAVDDVPPYQLARRTASLDHLHRGRSGWWCTGTAGLPAGRAEEHAQVLRVLWESWEPDAVVGDVAGGAYADHTKVHAVDHRGPHYAVRGPLNTVPSPQGRPLLVVSADGERSVDLAARWADVLLLDGRPGADDERADSVARLRAALVRAGRGPGDCLALVRVPSTDPDAVEAVVRSCGADGFLVDVPAADAAHEVEHRLTAATADLVRVLTARGHLAPRPAEHGLRRRLLEEN